MYEITKVVAIAAVSCVALYATARSSQGAKMDTLLFYVIATALLIWGC